MKPIMRIFTSSSRSLMVYFVAAVAIVGCAGASVTPGSTTPPPATAAARPARIVVDDFAFSASQVSENSAIGARLMNSLSSTPAEQRQENLGNQAADTLASEIAKQLEELGFTVVRGRSSTQPANGDLVIDGKFLNLDEGNRLRRLMIGFGAGASKLDTQVNVFTVAGAERQPLMQFTTHADSGKMPGAAVTMGAGAAAQGGATVGMTAANAGLAGGKIYTSQLDYLSDKTADQVVAYLSQYFAQQGWISHGQERKVKLSDAP